MVPTYFCPWTLNLHIAIVLLHLRVHYSVEIKCYKSQIRIRISKVTGFMSHLLLGQGWSLLKGFCLHIIDRRGFECEASYRKTITSVFKVSFYPKALQGCRCIVFTHGVRMGGRAVGKSLSGLYLRNHKV